MATINLNGCEVIVDDEDFTRVSELTWHVEKRSAEKGNFYFRHTFNKTKEGKRQVWSVMLHRFVLGLLEDDGFVVDHIDRNTLNNSKSNLRRCSKGENNRNVAMRKTNTSGYKGVTWYKSRSKWMAQIKVNKKHITLGYFDNPQKAHEAYCEASAKYHGEFGRIA
jgi:hypothetical protein